MDPPEALSRIVDTLASTLELLEDIQESVIGQSFSLVPQLYIDLQGPNVSRHGSVSVFTIYVQQHNRVYLVDVHTLKGAAFAARTPSGVSLQSILESQSIRKAFFDVRNDSDALYNHYGIRLHGVEDIQLMENALRRAGDRTHLSGLARCITNDAPLSSTRKHDWERTRNQGLRLFHPDKGGKYVAFDQRPLDPVLVQYCINNVKYLPQLWRTYEIKLMETRVWYYPVKLETRKRIELSQGEHYNPQDEAMKLGPWPEEDREEARLKEEQEARYKAAMGEYFEGAKGNGELFYRPKEES